MTRQHHDASDLEDVVEDYADDGSDSDELPCPSCGRSIYEDTDRCPYCGDWVMPLAAAAGRRNWVWWTALILAAVLFATWGLTC